MKRFFQVSCRLLFLVCGLLAAFRTGQLTAVAQSPEIEVPAEVRVADALSRSFRHAVTAAESSIVAIRTVEHVSAPRIKDDRSEPYGYGDGTGVIIDRRGTILTNYHVIEQAEAITVRLFDGREFAVNEVRADPWSDLALLYIKDAGNLPEARLGDSGGVEVGDWVVAVGNSFGLGISVNPGTISSKERKLPDSHLLLLQTNAVTSAGNSGGPLLNLRGEVVGITEGAYGMSDGFEGLGLAIPADITKFVVTELTENRHVRWPYFGARFEDLSSDVARSIRLTSGQSGVILTRVSGDSPAARAGLAVGDVITQVRGAPVRRAIDLFHFFEQARPQDTMDIITVRNDQSTNRRVQLEFKPRIVSARRRELRPPTDVPTAKAYDDGTLGLTLGDLTDETRDKLGFNDDVEGVYVSDVVSKSAAGFHGVRRGMLIARVGGQPVRKINEFKKVLKEQSLEKGVLLLLCSPFGEHFVVLRPYSAKAINWSVPASDD